MERRIYIIPYKMGSKSVKLLKESLGAKRLSTKSKTFKPRDTDIYINWGVGEYGKCGPNPWWKQDTAGRWINTWRCVRRAQNKYMTFQHCAHAGVTLPKWTTNKAHIKEFLLTHPRKKTIYCRNTLTGMGGVGIVCIDKDTDPAIRDAAIKKAMLFTFRVPCHSEYRVHVMRSPFNDYAPKVISASIKKRRLDVSDEEVNWKVRNFANGFVYARVNDADELPKVVKEQSQLAVSSLGLHFGAVDVILGKDGKAYVLEVNSAPGIEGQTLVDYTNAFKEIANAPV